MPAPSPPWQEWEDAFVRDLSLSRAEVVARTGRSLWAVKIRSSVLGVDRTFRGRAALCPGSDDPWTDQELAWLWDRSLSLGDVQRLTGRTYSAVLHKSSRLSVGLRVSSNKDWTEEELEFLADTSLTLAEVSDLTGRTLEACRAHASIHGLLRRRESAGAPPARSNGDSWLKVRREVLARDQYRCCDCGKPQEFGLKLHVHHVIPYRLRPVNDPRWLLSLCGPCHRVRPEHRLTEIPKAMLRVMDAD